MKVVVNKPLKEVISPMKTRNTKVLILNFV